MYVNRETNTPAWLLSQDAEGVTFKTAPAGKSHQLPAHEFFGAHREATRAEIREHTPAAQSQAMQQNAPAKPAKPPQPPKAKQAAKKAAPKTARKEGGDPAKPSAAAHAPAPPPASGDPPAAKKEGEPHGETGTQTK